MTLRPVVFGEVLFDMFEDGRVLGGAPFNVAWHLAAFGADPLFVSRVGDDEGGAEIRAEMTRWGLATDGLQIDPQHATGVVNVTIDDGEPHYVIEPNRAYDFIDADLVPSVAAPLLYHGTLALRAETSRATLWSLRTRLDAPVFVDVNLRAPWWNVVDAHRVIEGIDTLKLSIDELAELVDEPVDDLADAARALRARHRVDRVVVTLGERGALSIGGGPAMHVAPTSVQDVVDTVGAGDAFTAVLLLGRLRRWPHDATLERAQQFASRIVRQRGAIARDRTAYEELDRTWTD